MLDNTTSLIWDEFAPLKGSSTLGAWESIPTCTTTDTLLLLHSHQWDCSGSNCILYWRISPGGATGYSVSWEMGIGGVLRSGCLVRVCPSQGICLRLLGLFLLLGLILSDALAIVLPSQVSNQILWMVFTLLYKIWRDIVCKETFPFCFGIEHNFGSN